MMIPPLSSILTVLSSTILTSTFTRYTTPLFSIGEWQVQDDELKKRLLPLNHHLARLTNVNDVAILGDQVGYTICNFLDDHPEIFPKPEAKLSNNSRKPRANKTLEELFSLKRELSKKLKKEVAGPSPPQK